MRSVMIESFGSPEAVVHLTERPLPEPGPGQVRLKLVAAPIHNHDLMIVAGRYGYQPPLPHAPGTEALGLVDALGAGVTHLAVGQRVTGGGSATWAEYYLASARSAVPVPDSIGDDTACQLVSMPLSARLLLEKMAVKAGDWIIQNAANGAVGKMLAGFAADHGVNVVSLVRRDAAIAELEAVGLRNIVSTESAGWQERVAGVTGGAPIIRGLDSVGGADADALLGVMGLNSVLYSFGALSGKPLEITPANLLFKQARVEGFWLSKLLETTEPALIGKLIGEIVGKAARGDLVLDVGGRFGLDEASAAMRAATTPGRAGKIVLTP